MLYKLRTGDILLCENKERNQTNMYIILYDNKHSYLS